jgi:hypothetical protein
MEIIGTGAHAVKPPVCTLIYSCPALHRPVEPEFWEGAWTLHFYLPRNDSEVR